jgi:biotin carboxyl carrier protein
MFTDSELETLIEAMRRSGVTELAVEQDGEALRLGLAPRPAAVAPATPPAPTQNAQVKSPAMGLLVPVGADDGLEAVACGARVIAGQILGYVADGDARFPLTATATGTLITDSPAASTLIGYGDVLFEIEADL